MVNLTISLPEETVRRLRKAVDERYGGRKGALSGLIKDALEERINSLEAVESIASFKALDAGGRLVAEGGSLDVLASRLGKKGVDPRAVRIVSSSPLRRVARGGLRGKRA